MTTVDNVKEKLIVMYNFMIKYAGEVINQLSEYDEEFSTQKETVQKLKDAFIQTLLSKGLEPYDDETTESPGQASGSVEGATGKTDDVDFLLFRDKYEKLAISHVEEFKNLIDEITPVLVQDLDYYRYTTEKLGKEFEEIYVTIRFFAKNLEIIEVIRKINRLRNDVLELKIKNLDLSA